MDILGCCLLELLFLPLEILFELVVEGWFSLMQWIVPERAFNNTTRIILKIVVGILTAVLAVIFLIGIFGAIFTEATVMDLWKLIFIPLGISLAQIALGIIVRLTSRKK